MENSRIFLIFRPQLSISFNQNFVQSVGDVLSPENRAFRDCTFLPMTAASDDPPPRADRLGKCQCATRRPEVLMTAFSSTWTPAPSTELTMRAFRFNNAIFTDNRIFINNCGGRNVESADSSMSETLYFAAQKI